MTAELETRTDAGKGPRGQVAYWVKELDLADKREKVWRKEARKTIERYRYDSRQEGVKRHNILWSNTETMRGLLYGKTPTPDIRRRFRDEDQLGKQVAEVLERAVSFAMDEYDFDDAMGNTVLDYLLPGRAVARVNYKPSFTEKEGEGGGKHEELAYQQVSCDTVAWDDYRQGPGGKWGDVPWVSFRHTLTREEVKEKFPDFADAGDIPLDYCTINDEDDSKREDDVFKRLLVWEIWDKAKRQVVFIAPSYEVGPLLIEEDKLKLQGFYPIPRPMLAIQSPNSLSPIVEYKLYRDQAEELDNLTARIDWIVKSIKVRGIYDSTMKEISGLLAAGDNELIPAESVAALYERGGLEKGIWMFPIQTSAAVLVQLMQQREIVKSEIYEITGMADIMRGLSDPNETLGAQQIKSNWAGTRLQLRQKEVQRFIRDLVRLKVEIIAEKFDPETLQIMTGQQVTPEMVAIMRSDASRDFRIDIETDSTIAGMQQDEQKNITELLSGVAAFVDGIGPAVQGGFIGAEAAKAMLLSAVRRFKLGREVEDALDQMGQQEQPQQPQIPPEVQQAFQQMQQQMQQMGQELEQAKAGEAEKMAKIQADQQAHTAKSQIEQQRIEAEVMAKKYIADLEAQLRREQMAVDLEAAKYKTDVDAQVKLQIAGIQVCVSMEKNEETME